MCNRESLLERKIKEIYCRLGADGVKKKNEKKIEVIYKEDERTVMKVDIVIVEDAVHINKIKDWKGKAIRG